MVKNTPNSIDVLFYRGFYNSNSIVNMPILRKDYPIHNDSDIIFLLITDREEYYGDNDYRKLKKLMERYLERKWYG